MKEETNQQEKADDTVAKVEIPKAGLKSFAMLVTVILVVIMYKSFKKYSRSHLSWDCT